MRVIHQNGRQTNLNQHHVVRPLPGRRQENAALHQLEGADDTQDQEFVHLPHGRKQRQTGKEEKPQQIEPARSTAYLIRHTNWDDCITRPPAALLASDQFADF